MFPYLRLNLYFKKKKQHSPPLCMPIKYSGTRLQRQEKDGIHFVLINECHSNRKVQCYGQQWEINWYHKIPDAATYGIKAHSLALENWDRDMFPKRRFQAILRHLTQKTEEFSNHWTLTGLKKHATFVFRVKTILHISAWSSEMMTNCYQTQRRQSPIKHQYSQSQQTEPQRNVHTNLSKSAIRATNTPTDTVSPLGQ